MKGFYKLFPAIYRASLVSKVLVPVTYAWNSTYVRQNMKFENLKKMKARKDKHK